MTICTGFVLCDGAMHTAAYLIRLLCYMSCTTWNRSQVEKTVSSSETYYQRLNGLPDFHEIWYVNPLPHVIGQL